MDISLKFKNYKCFGEEFKGFDRILPINVIIGRNNSGKSSLLDLIKYAVSPYDLSPLGYKDKEPQVILKTGFTLEHFDASIPPDERGGAISGNHLAFYKKEYTGKQITVTLANNGTRPLFAIEEPLPEGFTQYNDALARNVKNPLKGKVFKHLKAERDIRPEGDNKGTVSETGEGATTIIQQFINKASLPSELVEKTLLYEFNKIMQPDARFTDIVVQQLGNDKWEVFVEEKEKGRIALSQSGSGLQTIILVLIFLYLVPEKEGNSLSNYVFAFEELENNVHPALQRRLLLYLRDVVLKHECYFFLTTHSNVVIDLFSNDPEAQLIHTTHDGRIANAKRVEAYIQRQGILDDLDVRASDLLQSNGVVWVEGPSDRLYFNRWVEIWSDGKLREGAHYQCVFYGGRLLAHLTARVSEDIKNDLIRILLVNRNAIFLIDSDRQYPRQRLTTTKMRIRKEIWDIGAIFWSTKGKEIENYIPHSAIASFYNKSSIKQVEQYQSFSDYLDRIKKGEGKKFLSKKVIFAEKACQYLNKDNLRGVLDLDERLTEVCKRIKKWNAI